MLLSKAIEHASNLAYEEDCNYYVGRIGGSWEVAEDGDEGRIAEFDGPVVFTVTSSGVAPEHVEAGEITEDWELPGGLDEGCSLDEYEIEVYGLPE